MDLKDASSDHAQTVTRLGRLPKKLSGISETAVNEFGMILERMALTLSDNQRVEIRGFGSFSLHYRAARVGRNPKTGDAVDLRGKYVPYFKPGKELRTRVNNGI